MAKVVYVPKLKLYATVAREKKNHYILEGFTDVIKYVVDKSDTQEASIKKVKDLGICSFYSEIIKKYKNSKNNFINKRYRNSKDTINKTMLKDFNIYMAYHASHNISTKEAKEILIKLNLDENIELPIFKNTEKVCGYMFYNIVVSKITNAIILKIPINHPESFPYESIKFLYKYLDDYLKSK